MHAARLDVELEGRQFCRFWFHLRLVRGLGLLRQFQTRIVPVALSSDVRCGLLAVSQARYRPTDVLLLVNWVGFEKLVRGCPSADSGRLY